MAVAQFVVKAEMRGARFVASNNDAYDSYAKYEYEVGLTSQADAWGKILGIFGCTTFASGSEQ